jgi:hypothetical protein
MRVLVMSGDSLVEVVSVVFNDGGPADWTHTARIQPGASDWPMDLSHPPPRRAESSLRCNHCAAAASVSVCLRGRGSAES